MRKTSMQIITAVAFATAGLVAATAAQALEQKPTKGFNHKIPEEIMTPDKVESRIGTLEFFDGMPTDDTVKKVYDNLVLMRGTEAFLNGIPATSIEGGPRVSSISD